MRILEKEALTMRSLVPRGFFDSLFDTSLTRDIGWPDFFTNTGFCRQYPLVDIEEREDKYVVTADVPGFTKDNMDVEIENNVLSISGRVDDRTETTDTERGFVRRERRYGAFRRSFRLPEEVDPDKIKASFSNGILQIEIPKTHHKPSRRIKIS